MPLETPLLRVKKPWATPSTALMAGCASGLVNAWSPDLSRVPATALGFGGASFWCSGLVMQTRQPWERWHDWFGAMGIATAALIVASCVLKVLTVMNRAGL